MKKILILGTGFVSKPGINYLLNQKEFYITVASNEKEKAEAMISGYDNCRAEYIDVEDRINLYRLISEHDIVVSLLPWIYHPKVAELCLELKKHMVTTSYVNPIIRAMEDKVVENNLIFLNEIGVDPGIDHLSAMKIINEVKNRNEEVEHFYSYCGGLPAPQFNNNPLGYKFSWSPKGVLLATKNSAKFLENGEVVLIDGQDLFLNCVTEEIENLGTFEVYPNRDSLPYKEIYGLNNVLTLKRGTYRNLGWCETMNAIVKLGLINESPRANILGNSYKCVVKSHLGISDIKEIKKILNKISGSEAAKRIYSRLEWLGLFSDEIITKSDNLLDMLCELMQKKMYYTDGEVDMLLMRHRFIIKRKDGSRYQIMSTLIDYGIPYGDTSMSRTVSLPMAIAVKLIAQERIEKRGIIIPVYKEFYEPILNELESLGIKMNEEVKEL